MLLVFFVISAVLSLILIKQNEFFKINSSFSNFLIIFLFMAFTYNVLSLSKNFVGYLALYYIPLLFVVFYLNKWFIVIGNILNLGMLTMYLSFLHKLYNQLFIILSIVSLCVILLILIFKLIFVNNKFLLNLFTTILFMFAEFTNNLFINIRHNTYTLLTIGMLVLTYLLIYLFSYFVIKKINIRQTELNYRLNQYSRDGLTGLYNFGEFNKYFLQINKDNAQTETLFIIDIDKFKYLNDTYGHEYGNRILQFFGNSIKDVIKDYYVRSEYKVYRYGGEEFVVTVNGHCLNVEEILNKISINILKDGQINFGEKITFSAGVSFNDFNQKNNVLTFESADILLYEVKRSGRNGYLIEKKA